MKPDSCGDLMLCRVISLCVLWATVLASVGPFAVAVADVQAPLEGLNEAENAYVARMNAAYATSNAALDHLSSELGGAALGALFGGGMPEPTELLNMVLECRAGLASAAPAFAESPPPSMDELAGIHATISSRLDSAFSPAMSIVLEEGKNRLLQAGSQWLSGLLGASAPPDLPTTSFKARLASSVLGEIGDLQGLLDSGQAELNAQIKAVQETQAAGEDFLNFFFDDCFIATAAYGTSTAGEMTCCEVFAIRF